MDQRERDRIYPHIAHQAEALGVEFVYGADDVLIMLELRVLFHVVSGGNINIARTTDPKLRSQAIGGGRGVEAGLVDAGGLDSRHGGR